MLLKLFKFILLLQLMSCIPRSEEHTLDLNHPLVDLNEISSLCYFLKQKEYIFIPDLPDLHEREERECSWLNNNSNQSYLEFILETDHNRTYSLTVYKNGTVSYVLSFKSNLDVFGERELKAIQQFINKE